jgi:PHD/YefM family antitoxin component YafN of YafNO toxin-antitoxin module
MIDIIKLKEANGEVVMSKEDFESLRSEVESLIETVELLSDQNLMTQLRESEKDIKEGAVKELETADDMRRLFLK